MLNIIPIVFATDNNFLKQTFVAIASILKNRMSAYHIEFYILVPDIEKINCEVYIKRLESQFKDFEIRIIEMDSQLFEHTALHIKHISQPTYYRLMIPELLKQYDKCIYLDGDIVVYGDINELYEYDITGYCIGGVKMTAMQLNENVRNKYIKLGILKTLNTYINAGVLLMDLHKLRQRGMTKKFMECAVQNQFPMQDQDVINICCYQDIKPLPYYFNAFMKEYGTDREQMYRIYNINDLERAYSNPFIIHYADVYTKPWNNPYLVLAEEWWAAAACVLSGREIKEMQMAAEERIKKTLYIYLLEACKNAGRIVIFGFSDIGKQLYRRLKADGITQIAAFCDNNRKKQAEFYDGLKCMSVDELTQNYNNALIINTSQLYYDIIHKQLVEEGIKEENIIRYVFKHEYFYKILRDEILKELQEKGEFNTNSV